MSSDSSDVENEEMLREALDVSLINDTMYTKSAGNHKPEELIEQTVQARTPKLESLRPSKESDEFNIFGVTPEFQNYVAKHLSKLLDKELVEVSTNTTETVNKNRSEHGGIRLFTESKYKLKSRDCLETDEVCNTKRKKIQKRKLNEDLGVENGDDVFKSVAVSPDYILSKNETKSWSKRTKHKPIEYRQNKNGTLDYVENKLYKNTTHKNT